MSLQAGGLLAETAEEDLQVQVCRISLVRFVGSTVRVGYCSGPPVLHRAQKAALEAEAEEPSEPFGEAAHGRTLGPHHKRLLGPVPIRTT